MRQMQSGCVKNHFQHALVESSHQHRIQNLAPLHTNCVTLSKSLNLSATPLPHQQNSDNNTYLAEALQGLNEIMNTKPGMVAGTEQEYNA